MFHWQDTRRPMEFAEIRVSSKNGICFSWLSNHSSWSISPVFEQIQTWVGQLSFAFRWVPKFYFCLEFGFKVLGGATN